MIEGNVVLVSLIDNKIEKIGLALAKKLDFFYLNVEELIKYNLFDIKKMEEICGIEYLTKQESRIISSLNTYERTVMSLQYETFVNNLNNILTNNILVYLNFPKNTITNKKNKCKNDFEKSNAELSEMVYKERTKFLQKNCKFDIDCSSNNVTDIVKLIVDKIKE